MLHHHNGMTTKAGARLIRLFSTIYARARSVYSYILYIGLYGTYIESHIFHTHQKVMCWCASCCMVVRVCCIAVAIACHRHHGWGFFSSLKSTPMSPRGPLNSSLKTSPYIKRAYIPSISCITCVCVQCATVCEKKEKRRRWSSYIEKKTIRALLMFYSLSSSSSTTRTHYRPLYSVKDTFIVLTII